jgi:hypothetical protein
MHKYYTRVAESYTGKAQAVIAFKVSACFVFAAARF